MFNSRRLLGTLVSASLGRSQSPLAHGRMPGMGTQGGLMDVLGTLAGGGMGGARAPGMPPRSGAGTYGDQGRGQGGGIGVGLGAGAALALLGGLALNALKERRSQSGERAQAMTEATEATADDDRSIDDRKAVLLIRAMAAAANADGQIDAQERQRILGRLSDVGISDEERQFVERELQSPTTLDVLVREVDGPETAIQVYAASLLAITADTDVERLYLGYLASRLGLSRETVQDLHQRVGLQ